MCLTREVQLEHYDEKPSSITISDDTNSMDMPDGNADGDIEILDTRGAASTSTPKLSFSGSPYGSADAYGGQKYGDDYTDWHSQCEFACRECGKVFRQPATLQNHIKTQHNMDSDSYKFKHGVRTLMTNEVSTCDHQRNENCHRGQMSPTIYVYCNQ